MTTVKSCHAPSIWKKMRWKSLCLLILKSIMEIIKNFKSLYDFGGRCLKIRDVCMDFEPYFKVHTLVSVHPKSVIFGQITNLNMLFHVVVSNYRLVKIWNSPQFPDEFRNGQLSKHTGTTGVLGPGFWGTRRLAKPRPWVLKSLVPERPVVPVCKISGCKISRFALELFYILKKDAAILLWVVEEEE